ncbi:hypothetical protein DV738_g1852, partial [Chaetothyriales sp. CBS 135597]
MVFGPDSPPISPKTTRDGKRSQQTSNNEFSVEELPSDSVGYDADIEVVKPDHIEEPDSESEDDQTALSSLKRLLWPDTDEELANKMKELSWPRPEQLLPRTRDVPDLIEPKSDTTLLRSSPRVNAYGKRSEIDVEMAHSYEASSAAKRRKRRDDRAGIIPGLDARGNINIVHRDLVRRPKQTSQSTGAEVTQELPVESNEMDLD